MFKVNNKDNRMTPMASFWCLYCYFEHITLNITRSVWYRFHFIPQTLNVKNRLDTIIESPLSFTFQNLKNCCFFFLLWSFCTTKQYYLSLSCFVWFGKSLLCRDNYSRGVVTLRRLSGNYPLWIYQRQISMNILVEKTTSG